MCRPRMVYLLHACLIVLIWLLYMLPTPLHGYLHFLLMQFSHGISTGKIHFMLAFLFLVMLRMSLTHHPGHLIPTQGQTHFAPNSRYALLLLTISLGMGYIAALGGQLWFVHQMGLPTDWPAWVWHDGINSSTAITHTHTSKACIAWLCERLNLTHVHQHFDTGYPFLRLLPTWLLLIDGLAFLIALITGITLAPAVIDRYPLPQRSVISWVYALACGSALKCTLDGGPLAYDAVAGLMMLIMLCRCQRIEDFPRELKQRWVYWLAGLTLWAGAVQWFDASSLWILCQRGLYRLAIYLLMLWLVTLLLHTTVSRRWFFIGSTLTALLCGGFLWQSWRDHLGPLHSPAPAWAVIYDAQGSPTQVALPASLDLRQAYQLLGEHPWRTRAASLALTRETTTGVYAEIVMITGSVEVLPQSDQPTVRIRQCQFITDAGRARMYLQVAFDAQWGPQCWSPSQPTQLDENERFVAYHLLDQQLRRCGLKHYVMVPYVFFRDHALDTQSTNP